jgi:hypothetical protein
MSQLPGPDAEGDSQPRTASRAALEHLSYALSLPERALRSASGLVGGLARESAELLVPQSFQNSRTYTTMVRQMLDFMVHDVGGVAAGDKPSSTAEVDNYVARKAVGNFVEMASMATLHLSPLVILAAVSDLAYGSQAYLKELAGELKAQGVIDEQSTIDHVHDLLGAVSHASAVTSQAFDTPPLSVEALRQTIEQTKAAIRAPGASGVPSQDEVRQMWTQMREIADRDGVNLLSVGGAATMQSLGKFATLSRGALSTVRVAGTLFDRHVLDHYSQALDEIRRQGFYRSVAQSSQPYIAAVWDNFHSGKTTITQDVLSGKPLESGYRSVRRWLGGRQPPPPPDPPASSADQQA